MEQFDKNSEEAINELLRKYLLEESERDQLAEEALEMHADFVFSEEPVMLPSAAKEQQMISMLQEKIATPPAGKSYWKIFWPAPILALVVFGLFMLLKSKPTTEVAQNNHQNEVKTTPPAIAANNNPTALDTNVSTNLPVTVDTSSHHHRHASKKPDTTNHITVIPDPLNSNTINNTATNTIVAVPETRPQADLKALTKQALRKMNQFITQFPSERVYVHTDREVYQPGQDIWFSAYLRNEYELQPSNISDIVKVQLSDPDGKVVSAIEVLVKDGIAQGDIRLAYGLPEGVYHFKAYTNWQQNIPAEFQFEKDIFVTEPDITFNGDSIRSKLLKSAYPPVTSGAGTEAAAALRLEFYPEGGEMVSNHVGRVAFQVLDKNSEPIAVEGYVVDQSGNRAANFRTSYRGMGMFPLQPESGSTYTAYLTKPAGIKASFILPKPVDNNLALAVEKVERDNATLAIHSPSASKGLLIVQVRGQIVFTRQYELKAGDNKLVLTTKTFPTGVAQFTLFNAYGEPVAERLAFVNSHKMLNVLMVADKSIYQPREKVSMSVKVTDDKGQPVQGHFSLSVHDALPLANEINGQGNIISKLMLEADLGGHVDDAAAYFDNKDPLSTNHLDLLLMTRGWRKYSWKQLLTDAPPTLKYPYEKGMLKGTVVDPTGQPLKGIRIEVKGSNVKLMTNSEGKFEIRKLDLSEPKELLLSYKSGLMGYVVNRYDDNMTILFYGDNRRVYTQPINDAVHPVISGLQKVAKDSAVIIGQVTDVYGDGIPKATVTALSGDKKTKTTTTDARGFYTLPVAQAGEYLLEATAIGYQNKALKATLKQGNSVITDFQLSVEKQLMSEVRMAEERSRIKVTDPNLKFAFISPEARLLAAGDKNAILENSNEQDKQDLAKQFNAIDALPGDITNYYNGVKTRPNEAYPISNGRLQSIGQQNGGVPAKYESSGEIMDITSSNDDYNFNTSDKNRPDNFKAKYYKAREFPTMKYKVRERPDKPTDFRNTLYWNGFVETDVEGKATVQFFNSDNITTFTADMQGISEKGMPGAGSTTFQSQLPFKVFADVPMITDQTKHVEVPIYFSNASGLLLNGKLEYHFPESVHAIGPLVKDYTIFPPAKDTLSLGLDIVQGKTPGKMEIIFTTNGYRYVLSKYIGIVKAKPEN